MQKKRESKVLFSYYWGLKLVFLRKNSNYPFKIHNKVKIP